MEAEKSDNTKSLRLTQYSSGSGCGCKIHPALLEEILAGRKTGDYPGLVVGNSSGDDASAIVLNGWPGMLLIQTTDFFTPIVDDPFMYGKIAAANALSDVYAMGGKPLMANALLGWPVEKLPPAMAGEVLDGAMAMCKEAGIPLAGGHSIHISEPVFGLSATGTVEETRLKRNSSAQTGDHLFITRPIVVGMLATAHKRGLLDEIGLQELYRQCSHLNREGRTLSGNENVTAMTDVTGFGLYGHLLEMCRGAGLSAELFAAQVPLIEYAREFAAGFVLPDNTFRNWNGYSAYVDGGDETAFAFFNDPQTNGGLLFTVKHDALDSFRDWLDLQDFNASEIGRMIPAREDSRIYVI